MGRGIVTLTVLVLTCPIAGFAGWNVDIPENMPSLPIIIAPFYFTATQFDMYVNGYDPSMSSIYYMSPTPLKSYSWSLIECISGIEPPIVEMAESPWRTFNFAYVGYDNAVYYLHKDAASNWLKEQITAPFSEAPRFMNILLASVGAEQPQVFFMAESDGSKKIFAGYPNSDGDWHFQTIGVEDDGWGLQATAVHDDYEDRYEPFLLFYNPREGALKWISPANWGYQEETVVKGLSEEPEFIGCRYPYRDTDKGLVVYRDGDKLMSVDFSLDGSEREKSSVIYEGTGSGVSFGLNVRDYGFVLLFYEPMQHGIVRLTRYVTGDWEQPEIIWEVPEEYLSAKILLVGLNYLYGYDDVAGLLVALETEDGLYKVGIIYEDGFWDIGDDDDDYPDDDCGDSDYDDDDVDDNDDGNSSGLYKACGCS